MDSLAILTNGPAMSGFGQNPNGQISSAGAFRQYTDKYDLTLGPVRFKKFSMLSVTEQLFISKFAGSQNPVAKQSMSGGKVVESTFSSPDAMVGMSREVEKKTRASVIYYPSGRQSPPVSRSVRDELGPER